MLQSMHNDEGPEVTIAYMHTARCKMRQSYSPGGGDFLRKSCERFMPASISIPGCIGVRGELSVPRSLLDMLNHDVFRTCCCFGSTCENRDKSVGAPDATWLTSAQRDRHRRITIQLSCKCEPESIHNCQITRSCMVVETCHHA
jgi:hypothetical protein